jgi:hypothetical protein
MLQLKDDVICKCFTSIFMVLWVVRKKEPTVLARALAGCAWSMISHDGSNVSIEGVPALASRTARMTKADAHGKACWHSWSGYHKVAVGPFDCSDGAALRPLLVIQTTYMWEVNKAQEYMSQEEMPSGFVSSPYVQWGLEKTVSWVPEERKYRLVVGWVASPDKDSVEASRRTKSQPNVAPSHCLWRDNCTGLLVANARFPVGPIATVE